MAAKILDNGTLVTLGLVGVVAAVGAANKAGLYGSRSSMTCPGCGQPITFDQGFTECGGQGEGICAEAVFAFDQKVHGRPHAVAEWKEMWENKRMPTQKKCDAIMAAHNAVVAAVGAAKKAGLYGSRSQHARYIVATVHNGTDWGVFKASAEDMRHGDDMTHAKAVKSAKDAAAGQKGSRWYDFGDVEYDAYED